MSSSSNVTIVLEIVDRLRKSWWTIVTGLCVGLAVAVVALHYMPKTYRASTLVFVAPQMVPQEFVRSTVTDDMSIRLQSLRESVLSRPYMVKLVNRYIGNPADPVELETLLNDTRSQVEVDLIGIEAGNGEKTGGTFRLSYKDRDPKRAADMVNALAQLYKEQNVSSRTTQAEGTTKTIEGLAGDVESKFKAQQRLIADFKREHLYETSEQQPSNLQQLAGRQQDLNGNAVALAAAQDRLSALKAQQSVLGAASGTVDPLAKCEDELRKLRERYTETHPEVISKRRECENLKAPLPTSSPTSPAGDAGLTPGQAGIRSAEREVQRLLADAVQIKKDIAEYKRRLEATPKVQAQLDELTKGYDVLSEQYKKLLGNAQEARGAQKIEETQKGERFEIIETATPPAIPMRPIPIMIYAIGAIGGLVLFVGPLLVKAALEPLICSEAGLIEAADVPVLVTIPRLMTPDIAIALRSRLVGNVALSSASIVLLIVMKVIYR